jgi:S1-C subfamily serine protease
MSVTADFGVGSSGGPVLDETGRVVGMVAMTAAVIAADTEEEQKNPPALGLQMVFKDCVPLMALQGLIGPAHP